MDRHYFLAFFTTSNNKYVYSMQYESFMHFFSFGKKMLAFAVLSMEHVLVACLDCIFNLISCWLWVFDGRKYFNEIGGCGGYSARKVKIFRTSEAPFQPFWHKFCRIGLITVFDAILTGRQSDQKWQCLYGNPIANNFFQQQQQFIYPINLLTCR